jgi:hypothetical protein
MAPILKGSGHTYSFPATTSIAEADVGKFLVLSSGAVAVAGTAGADAVGVALHPTLATGGQALVQINGVIEVQAGGTITAGQRVGSNNAGLAIVATTGHRILGRALTAGASGGRVTILLDCIADSVV